MAKHETTHESSLPRRWGLFAAPTEGRYAGRLLAPALWGPYREEAEATKQRDSQPDPEVVVAPAAVVWWADSCSGEWDPALVPLSPGADTTTQLGEANAAIAAGWDIPEGGVVRRADTPTAWGVILTDERGHRWGIWMGPGAEAAAAGWLATDEGGHHEGMEAQ